MREVECGGGWHDILSVSLLETNYKPNLYLYLTSAFASLIVWSTAGAPVLEIADRLKFVVLDPRPFILAALSSFYPVHSFTWSSRFSSLSPPSCLSSTVPSTIVFAMTSSCLHRFVEPAEFGKLQCLQKALV